MKKTKITITPEPGKKYFYNYPTNIIAVVVKSKDKVNIMPAAWCTSLSYNPPLYGVSIGLDRYTCKLLEEADSFSINFIEAKHAHVIRVWGRSTGNEIDKIKDYHIKLSAGEKCPILDLAYCTYECTKKDKIIFGDHALFVGEVTKIHVAKRAMKSDGLLNTNNINPLLYLGVDNYLTIDRKSRISLKNLPIYYKNGKYR